MTPLLFDTPPNSGFTDGSRSSAAIRTFGARRRLVREALGLVVSLAVCFAAAGIGGALTATSLTDWYLGLAKPSWNPPNWIFGPVWTMLYILMAIAAWLVWRAEGWRSAALPLTVFAIQLVLNVAWSGLFFALQNPAAAFGEVLLLWLAIAATVFLFCGIDRVAAALLAPYLTWVSFAAVLNFAVWQLNR
ncbi:MAG TPA: TspO/MBR family protein [Pirellulales bacterium]|jgi:tryptophan-rich sensory protein